MAKSLILLLCSLGTVLAFYEGLKFREGIKADPPFALLLRIENDPPFCSGFLMDPYTVLTTASCLSKYNCKDIYTFRSGYTEKYTAKDCILHENYTRKATFDDIGIIKLKDPIKMSVSDSLSVNLPSKGKIPLKQVMYYGYFPQGNNFEVGELDIKNPVKCEEILGSGRKFFSKDKHLCTDAMYDSSKESCASLPGGTLIESTDNKSYLLGIWAWGSSPCNSYKQSPLSVYTRVSEYRDWIDMKMK